MTKEGIKKIIFAAIEMANHTRETSDQIPIADDTDLYGVNGHLDSMGLVAFLIDIEESFLDEGIKISLSDERAMSQTQSPFRTVQSLVDYISDLTGDA